MNISDYKNKEAAHYDYKAISKKASKSNYADYVTRQSRNLYFEKIEELLANNNDAQKILDYGCGSGEKHFQFSSTKNHITGIDISENQSNWPIYKQKKKILMRNILLWIAKK